MYSVSRKYGSTLRSAWSGCSRRTPNATKAEVIVASVARSGRRMAKKSRKTSEPQMKPLLKTATGPMKRTIHAR